MSKTWEDISDERIIVGHNHGITGMLVETVQYWNPYRNMYVSAYLVHCDDVGEDEEGLSIWLDHEVTEIITPNQELLKVFGDKDEWDEDTKWRIDEDKYSLLEKANILLR
jgi:hypothetical protein